MPYVKIQTSWSEVVLDESNLLYVSRESFKESLRTFLIPEWRLHDFVRKNDLDTHQRMCVQNITCLDILEKGNVLEDILHS